MSEVPTQTQDPPATEISEAMVEAAARAMWDHDTDGVCWSYASTTAPAYRERARVALIAGIAAALEKGR